MPMPMPTKQGGAAPRAHPVSCQTPTCDVLIHLCIYRLLAQPALLRGVGEAGSIGSCGTAAVAAHCCPSVFLVSAHDIKARVEKRLLELRYACSKES